MADTPITGLTAILAAAVSAANDVLALVDVSAGAGSKNKKITVDELLKAMLTTYNVSVTELGYLDGLTSAIQTQIDALIAIQTPTPVVLTPGATVAVNAALRAPYVLTPAQNFTLSNPTGSFDGQVMHFHFIQDGTGGWVMTLDTKFVVPSDIGTVVLPTDPGARSRMTVIRYAGSDTFDVAAFTKEF